MDTRHGLFGEKPLESSDISLLLQDCFDPKITFVAKPGCAYAVTIQKSFRNYLIFLKLQPLLVSEKVLQYTSNLYDSTPSIDIAVPSWLLSPKKGKPNSTPPMCTAVRLPFVRQYASRLCGSTFEKVLGLGVAGTFLNNSKKLPWRQP